MIHIFNIVVSLTATVSYLLSHLCFVMDDTPQHVKDLQLKIWLAKPPMERLRQFLIDDDALYAFWDKMKADRVKQQEANADERLLRRKGNEG